MKTLTAILTAGAVLSLGTHTLSAGDREWATAGKILTGLVIGGAVAKALEPPQVYHAPTVVYVAQPPVTYVPVQAAPPPVVYVPPPRTVYVQPAPVVVHPAPVYVVRPAPVYYYPPPTVVGVHFSFGSGRHYHHHQYRPSHRACR
jgi:hypothetical protein